MKTMLNINNLKQLTNVCGSFNEHLNIISENLNVKIINKGANFTIIGNNEQQALSVLQDLLALAKNKIVDIYDVEMSIKAFNNNELISPSINIKTCEKTIYVRSTNQKNYVKSIINKNCTFGIGPAGTGKTYLAVALAIESLEKSYMKRIILTRPAVETGEKLGFLPGALAEKVEPYLRPIYDALYEMMGFKKTTKLIEKNIIEVAPLAFMRGRTLNESFIILDEAQNTTIEQMKMFLTRMGFGSKMTITGDITQIDLIKPKQSGLLHAIKVLKNQLQISFCYFKAADVVRHKLVQDIVLAYERFQN